MTGTASDVTIVQVETDAHIAMVSALWKVYLTWADDMNDQQFGIRLGIATNLKQDLADIQKFMPPAGRLLIALAGDRAAGCIALKRQAAELGEIKRMYVSPDYRRGGIAQALALRILDEARLIGYTSVRLDSARYMTGAHALYRSLGFREIPPYPESEVPAEYHRHWVFMELSNLADSKHD